jgi:N-acetylglucosaminyl-diphospho-decaprenol L-rhamnosyltransferase
VVEVVVVENGSEGSANEALDGLGVTLVQPGVNLGYGRGVNRGAAFTPPSEYLLVSNPDVVVHEGAVRSLVAFLDEHVDVGLVGPRILSSDGATYPSVRRFPNVFLAGTHALLAPLWKNNPWTKKYRSPGKNGRVDWVSGAFFLVRRSVYELVGGFDERYFMFGEDMDLCWRVGRAGYRVDADLDAVVTHVEGVSRKRAPRAMTIAHHRSAIRFEWQTASGWRRLLAPLAIGVLLLRLGLVLLVGKGTD